MRIWSTYLLFMIINFCIYTCRRLMDEGLSCSLCFSHVTESRKYLHQVTVTHSEPCFTVAFCSLCLKICQFCVGEFQFRWLPSSSVAHGCQTMFTHLAQFSIVNELWTVSMNECTETQTIFPAETQREREVRVNVTGNVMRWGKEKEFDFNLWSGLIHPPAPIPPSGSLISFM